MEDASFDDGGFDEMDKLFMGSQPDVDAEVDYKAETVKQEQQDGQHKDQQQQQQQQLMHAKQPHLRLGKKLTKWLESMTVSGCCQRIAWSKFGSIANISQDKKKVLLRGFIQQHIKNEFRLNDPVEIEFPPLYEPQDIVHIAWSHTGIELAVVDAGGRINLFSIFVFINKLNTVGKFYEPKQVDALEAVVGIEWLYSPRQFGVYPAATRSNDSAWNYTAMSPRKHGPEHPAHKQALFFVTRGGKLNLLYVDIDGTCHTVTETLGISGYIDSVLTHAAFSLEQDSSVLLVTYDVAEILRVYRLHIDWHYPFGTKDQPHPPAGYHIQPTLGIKRLVSLSSEDPVKLPDDGTNPKPWGSFHILKILAMDQASKDANSTVRPTILAFKNVQEDSANSQRFQPHTRMYRWELEEYTQDLTTSFQQLTMKRKKSVVAVNEKVFRLKELDTVRLDGLVNSVELIRVNTVVAISKTDGSVEFRNRKDLESVSTDSVDHVENLLNVGFYMPPSTDDCLHTSLSPNACLAVTKNEDDALIIRQFEPPPSLAGTSSTDPLHSATIAAFCLVLASASLQQFNSDDILSLLQKLQPILGPEKPLEGIYTSLNIAVDAVGMESPEKLLRSHIILRALSAQESLGRIGQYWNIPSKLASIIISLRSCSFALHYGFDHAGSPQEVSVLDLPTSLIGYAQWYLDLIIFILGDLSVLSEKVRGRENDLSFVQAIIKEHKSLTIPLLLSSVPRVLLRYDSRCLRSVLLAAQKFANLTPLNPVVHRDPNANRNIQISWKTLFSIADRSPIDVRKFETALDDVEYHVKATYDTAKFNDAKRAAAERSMLITGKVPDILTPVITRLMTVTLERLLDGCDMIKVRFADTSWLGLQPEGSDGGSYGAGAEALSDAVNPSANQRRAYHESKWDILRKVPMDVTGARRGAGTNGVLGLTEVSGAAGSAVGSAAADAAAALALGTSTDRYIRKCTRCGGCMEDIAPGSFKPGKLPQWILTLQKTCICGCSWVRVKAETLS